MSLPDSFVDGIDQDERAVARRLCHRFKGADELLRGETRKVELLEGLGPGCIRADKPLPHEQHRRSAGGDTLAGYIAKQMCLTGSRCTREEHQSAARNRVRVHQTLRESFEALRTAR